MKPIKIVIAMDNIIFSRGIEEFLKKEPDMEITGRVLDVSMIVKALESRPDIVVLDQQFLDADEIALRIRSIKNKAQETKIIMFIDADCSDTHLIHYLKHGSDGFIRRCSNGAYVVRAIRSVFFGDMWADRKLLKKFVESHHVDSRGGAPLVGNIHDNLTKREKEIASLLLLGLTNRALSDQLHISEKTVKTHLNNIFRKTKVSNRTQLVSSLISFPRLKNS